MCLVCTISMWTSYTLLHDFVTKFLSVCMLCNHKERVNSGGKALSPFSLFQWILSLGFSPEKILMTNSKINFFWRACQFQRLLASHRIFFFSEWKSQAPGRSGPLKYKMSAKRWDYHIVFSVCKVFLIYIIYGNSHNMPT